MSKWEVTWSERVCYRLEVEATDEQDAVRVARLHVESGEWTDSGGMDDVSAELVEDAS